MATLQNGCRSLASRCSRYSRQCGQTLEEEVFGTYVKGVPTRCHLLLQVHQISPSNCTWTLNCSNSTTTPWQQQSMSAAIGGSHQVLSTSCEHDLEDISHISGLSALLERDIPTSGQVTHRDLDTPTLSGADEKQ